MRVPRLAALARDDLRKLQTLVRVRAEDSPLGLGKLAAQPRAAVPPSSGFRILVGHNRAPGLVGGVADIF